LVPAGGSCGCPTKAKEQELYKHAGRIHVGEGNKGITNNNDELLRIHVGEGNKGITNTYKIIKVQAKK
jgi:hypothetical protein